MLLPALIATALAVLLVQPAAPVGDAVAPARRQIVPLPDFDAERGHRWSSTREEYDAARADTAFVFEQFTYESDGLTVGAYLYRPRESGSRRWPVVVYNRGGYTRPTSYAGEMLVMANRLGRAGFIVVAPHLRGSVAGPGRDELGGADVHDVLNVRSALARIDGADSSRVFLAGESRGGAMVYMALRAGFPAKAAATWGAFTDIEPLLAPGTPTGELAKTIWPDLARDRAAIVETRSAMRWVSRLDVPVLIMHGTADEDMPIEHSRRLAGELARLGKTHRYLEFEGEQHRIGGRGVERDAAMVAWFRRFGGE